MTVCLECWMKWMMQMPDGQFDRVARFSVRQGCWMDYSPEMLEGVVDRDR